MHFAAISLVVTAAAAVAAALADVCYDATSEETSLVQRLHKGGKARSNATSKMNDIPCDLMRDTCSTSFPEAADSEEDCQLDTAKADAVCKVRGVADECADAFTTIEVGCTQAVKAGQSFGSQQCRDVVGCDCKFRGVADGGKCHPRSKCCQNPGAVCGMYQNKFPRFQCCSSYAFVDGDFWCQNGGGGACSDGNNNNCASGTVCGRYSSNPKDFQCCAGYQVLGGVAWCANSQGAECSDGVNENCVSGLACGRWGSSASGYACCSNYTVSSEGTTSCTSV
eukprot:TRINITY_DN3889_c0_g1_i4.p1 TRINITY_DN3889_c0_g1~~TRINITY_DN3889_c0_g1_i4.p1  ORF type:complete len:281 (+),score=31.15 TRINITY_DN3889_c0_g1_i4:161-1003(+)